MIFHLRAPRPRAGFTSEVPDRRRSFHERWRSLKRGPTARKWKSVLRIPAAYSCSRRIFLRARLRASAAFVRFFSPGFR
jgi:hypothetical protein